MEEANSLLILPVCDVAFDGSPASNHSLLTLLPTDKRYRSICCCTTRLQTSDLIIDYPHCFCLYVADGVTTKT